MSIDRKDVATLIMKKANDSGRDITEQEANELANDNLYSELFSVQSPSPQFDQQLSDLIEKQWSEREGG